MKFSFVIPAKNEANTIDLCIKSILDQNLGEHSLDLIVIDDYSCDNTIAVAKGLGATVIIPDLPCGKTTRAYNKNYAFQFCSGEFIIFFDAHIILPSKDWLLEVAAVISSNTENQLLLISFPALPPPELTILLNYFSPDEVRNICYFVTSTRGPDQFVGGSMMISKECFNRLGGFPLIPASEDVTLYREAKAKNIRYIFAIDLWVWHLDKKLQYTLRWLKRNVKEGFFSAFSITNPDTIGSIFSILLGFSFLLAFFYPFLWILFLSLSTANIAMQFCRGVKAMRVSTGKMTLLHLVTLTTIQSIQAFTLRISAFAGLLVRFFSSLRRSLLRQIGNHRFK